MRSAQCLQSVPTETTTTTATTTAERKSSSESLSEPESSASIICRPKPHPQFIRPAYPPYSWYDSRSRWYFPAPVVAKWRIIIVFGMIGLNTAQMRPGLAPSTPLNPHSLQVGSHLPLQHRNSFCVSALSHQSSLYSTQGYSSLSCGAPDPFTFSHPHRMHFDELPSEVCI